MTIIEVMIALAVIATGVAALLDGLYSQSVARQSVRDSERVVALSTTLQERFQSLAWDSIGLVGWTTPTAFDAANPFIGGHDENGLLAASVISQPTGLNDLRMYVEYYLAQSQLSPLGGIERRGLMDAQSDSDSDGIVDRFPDSIAARIGLAANIANSASAAAAGTTRTVRYDSDPTGSIPDGQPLAIRLVLVWRGTGAAALGSRVIPGSDGRMLEMILARGAN